MTDLELGGQHGCCRERTCQIVTFIEQNHSVYAPQGVARHPGKPLSDWSAALRESHHLWPSPITRNHVEHCMLLITAGLDTSPTLNYEDPLQPTEHQRTDMAEYPRERAKRLAPFTSSF